MTHYSPDRPARRASPRAGGERTNVRGSSTRRRILTEAERLFAERGISATPLRDIGHAAGQRNHAAVRYHFGDRDDVVRAIMELRGAESEAVRAEIVADLMAAGTTPTVHDVVDAFVRPLAIHFQPDNHYLAFLSLYITEKGGYEGLNGVNAGVSVGVLLGLLKRLTPHIPEAVLQERWWLTLTSAVHALARYQSAERNRPSMPASINVLIDDVVAFLSAGLTAPVAQSDPRGRADVSATG